jgi:hypothetical protein
VVKTSVTDKFAVVQEHWRPKDVAELNGQELNLVKLAGVFPWHQHEGEDELFLVWRGEMVIEVRDRRVVLQSGGLRVVEHRSMADVLVFKSAATRNTAISLTRYSARQTVFKFDSTAWI